MSEEAPLWQKVGRAVDSALHTLVGPDPEPPKEKPYRLGILFVHGMGQQERGDTITRLFGRSSQDTWTIWAMLWAAAAAAIPTAVIGWLAVSRADLTFFVIFAAITLVGVLVVIRLLRDDEARLADPGG